MIITIFHTAERPDIMGETHRYETERGIISLFPPCPINHFIWEIYSVKGNFFDNVENYSSKKYAEERIYNLLEPHFKYGK